MDFDDDAPPELVDTAVDNVGEQEITTKVPITIVTGAYTTLKTLNDLFFNLLCRLPRRRQDNIAQLHLDSPTWQEGRCHYEWYIFTPFMIALDTANREAEFGDCG